MREGFWINYRNGKQFPVDEHEQWLRRPGNSDKLGISDSLAHELFKKYEPVKDRDKMLTKLMHRAPIMRVRGHGSDITFEYASHSKRDPLEAIMDSAKKYAGPYSWLNIVNLATGENNSLTFNDFKTLMEEDRVEDVMRVASNRQRRIAKNILILAKRLLS